MTFHELASGSPRLTLRVDLLTSRNPTQVVVIILDKEAFLCRVETLAIELGLFCDLIRLLICIEVVQAREELVTKIQRLQVAQVDWLVND